MAAWNLEANRFLFDGLLTHIHTRVIANVFHLIWPIDDYQLADQLISHRIANEWL